MYTISAAQIVLSQAASYEKFNNLTFKYFQMIV